ncbi:MAG: molybdenum cofactor biosynthesis protein MoaE [Verrucomicrobiota bacterium]
MTSPLSVAAALQDPTPHEGAMVTFVGYVRAMEKGQKIKGLVYEAYASMARKEIERLAREIHLQHPVTFVRLIHRIGKVAVGEAAIVLLVMAGHRSEAFEFVKIMMDRLKVDVPIWKVDVVL